MERMQYHKNQIYKEKRRINKLLLIRRSGRNISELIDHSNKYVSDEIKKEIKCFFKKITTSSSQPIETEVNEFNPQKQKEVETIKLEVRNLLNKIYKDEQKLSNVLIFSNLLISLKNEGFLEMFKADEEFWYNLENSILDEFFFEYLIRPVNQNKIVKSQLIALLSFMEIFDFNSFLESRTYLFRYLVENFFIEYNFEDHILIKLKIFNKFSTFLKNAHNSFVINFLQESIKRNLEPLKSFENKNHLCKIFLLIEQLYYIIEETDDDSKLKVFPLFKDVFLLMLEVVKGIYTRYECVGNFKKVQPFGFNYLFGILAHYVNLENDTEYESILEDYLKLLFKIEFSRIEGLEMDFAQFVLLFNIVITNSISIYDEVPLERLFWKYGFKIYDMVKR